MLFRYANPFAGTIPIGTELYRTESAVVICGAELFATETDAGTVEVEALTGLDATPVFEAVTTPDGGARLESGGVWAVVGDGAGFEVGVAVAAVGVGTGPETEVGVTPEVVPAVEITVGPEGVTVLAIVLVFEVVEGLEV